MKINIWKGFQEVCPRPLLKPAVKIVKKVRAIRGRVGMIVAPDKQKCYCPCCGMRFQAFVAGNYKNYPEIMNMCHYEHMKQDVLCPVCRALPRHRILASWCDNHIELLRLGKILYFAPEYSMMLWMKRNNITCTTADLYKEADLKLDIQNTCLPDDSYDMIIANHVLEHVDDFRQALKEIYRILRNDGSFICSFPMDEKIDLVDEDPNVKTKEERVLRFGQHDHKRVFGMKADQLLADAGFSVEEIHGKDYPEEILPVIGPADYDMNILFWCRNDVQDSERLIENG